MHASTSSKTALDRRIGLCLSEQSLAPRVLEALRGLGYRFEANLAPDGEPHEDARVWLVDADRLLELPDVGEAPDLQLLMIASLRDADGQDPRVLMRAARPARLGIVYGMIQEALELTPRGTPRVPTRLSARCIRSDRRSIGAVLSLSEGGCLLRTSEALEEGCRVALQFALPAYGLISTRAECRYSRREGAGLAFTDVPPDVRHPIAHYVTQQLATRETPPGPERSFSAT